MHIDFNEQELNFTEQKTQPKKKGYKIIKHSKDHPFRKMNQSHKEDKRENFLRATLG